MKILLEAPILTQSGYGEHSRLVYRALKEHPGADIYINPLNWGQTSWATCFGENLEEEVVECTKKLGNYIASGEAAFDMQVHVGIPSEFEKKAPYSVCVTAGIETDRVSLEWLIRTHKGIDKLIVPSEHAKSGFLNTTYEVANNQTMEKSIINCNCPVEIVPYPVKTSQSTELSFTTDTDFNFLSVALLGPRKNIEAMVKWFVEEFKEDNVGLILKTGFSRGNPMDKESTTNHIKRVIAEKPGDRKCKVYLLHGDLEESEVHSLYAREDVHAYVTSTHGEGYGLPIFEAAYSGLPVVATDWSAHPEFLSAPFKENGKTKEKKLFAKVDYELAEIPKHVVWKDILVEGSRWSFPKEASFKKQIRNMYKNHGMYKKWAKSLQEHILENFSEDKVISLMNKSLFTQVHTEE